MLFAVSILLPVLSSVVTYITIMLIRVKIVSPDSKIKQNYIIK